MAHTARDLLLVDQARIIGQGDLAHGARGFQGQQSDGSGPLRVSQPVQKDGAAGSVSRQRDSAGAQQASRRVVVLGATTLDVQVDDRFTVEGLLYQVTFVRPNRRVAVVAEAEAVE